MAINDDHADLFPTERQRMRKRFIVVEAKVFPVDRIGRLRNRFADTTHRTSAHFGKLIGEEMVYGCETDQFRLGWDLCA